MKRPGRQIGERTYREHTYRWYKNAVREEVDDTRELQVGFRERAQPLNMGCKSLDLTD